MPKYGGTKETQGGRGRHNVVSAPDYFDTPKAKVRICLGCNHAFRSRGPWNRFCGRCHEQEDEHENQKTYKVPKEWPTNHDDDY